jgi:hypothetical protein
MKAAMRRIGQLCIVSSCMLGPAGCGGARLEQVAEAPGLASSLGRTGAEKLTSGKNAAPNSIKSRMPRTAPAR